MAFSIFQSDACYLSIHQIQDLFKDKNFDTRKVERQGPKTGAYCDLS